ncbi:MAG: hypothetical protein QXM75_00250 [Candidatus Diapherotrites archaeon]
MTKLLDYKKIVEKIVNATGKSENEVRGMISDKIDRFAGLLTEEGAAFMVAKELGLDIELEPQKGRFVKIGELKNGMKNICVLARVTGISEARIFQKGDRKGNYCKILIADSTGETTLTLWDKKIGMIESNNICKGDAIVADGCYVTEFNGSLSLSLHSNGKIRRADPSIDVSGLPEVSLQTVKLSEIKKPIKNLDFFSRVVRVFDPIEFERDGKKATTIHFEVWDGTAKFKAVAWRNLAFKAKRLYAGELIKVEGADVKEGTNGLEIHLGSKARIIEEPNCDFELPSIELVGGKSYEKTKISNINKEGYFEIFAEIVDIARGRFFYMFCPSCKSKASGDTCEICGTKTRKRLLISVRLDDGSGSLDCIFFGRNAENLLGLSASEIFDGIDKEGAEALTEKLRQRFLGAFILVRGSARRKLGDNEEYELVADDILPLKIKEEIERRFALLSEATS